MDQFKQEEITRMAHGGNAKWKEFCEEQAEWYEGMTLAEMYGSGFAEDYKEKVCWPTV